MANRKHPKDRKSSNFSFNLTDAEDGEFRALATASKMSLADYMRELLADARRNKTVFVPQPPLRMSLDEFRRWQAALNPALVSEGLGI